MKYLKIINKQIVYPYDPENIRKDNPNTSFPDILTQILLNQYNIYIVNIVEILYDYTKNYSEGIPLFVDGQYYQNWTISDATPQEIQQRIDGQWSIIRKERNQYLSECDWTQLPDSPLTTEKKTEWTVYRKALRDVTTQLDPFNIVWPTKPQ